MLWAMVGTMVAVWAAFAGVVALFVLISRRKRRQRIGLAHKPRTGARV